MPDFPTGRLQEGYSININPKKLGFNITAIIEVSMPKALTKDAEGELFNHPNVFGAYYTAGQTDCFLITKFKDTEGLNSFLKDLHQKDYIAKTDTHISLKILKEDFRGSI